MWYESIVDRGLIPDWALRIIVRQGLNQYKGIVSKLESRQISELQRDFRFQCRVGPIALNTDDSNRQHYGVPAEFFRNFLSGSMKYSGSIWNQNTPGLEEADQLTLRTYMRRASIANGHEILDLGCGWGSLSLQIARTHNNSKVTAVTNSSQQSAYIEDVIRKEKLHNLKVVKENIIDFYPSQQFDRILSIEMFEHIRDPESLLNHILSWMNPKGKLFLQVFSHNHIPQFFDDIQKSWMARHFFTGGMMPYAGLYADICGRLIPEDMWSISGTNYHRTLESWLYKLKQNENIALQQLREHWSKTRAKTYLNRYRLFLIFCSEMFKYNKGRDWHIMHYLFQN